MKEKVEIMAPKPILHGFLLGNGTFITPTEMRIMESLGVISATKV